MPSQRLSVISGPAEPELLNWTLNEVLRKRCSEHAERPVLHSQHQNESMTYKELDQQATHLAAGLSEDGIGKGDRVGILLGNRSEYAVVSFIVSNFRHEKKY